MPESGCCCLLIILFLNFSFSPIFSIEIFRHTFLRNCVAKKIETWYTRGHGGRCIVCTGIRLLLLIHSFIFLSLQFSTLKFFVILFSGTVRPRRLKLDTHVDSGQMYRVYRNQAAAAYSSIYFFILSLQFTNIKNSCHIFLRNCVV